MNLIPKGTKHPANRAIAINEKWDKSLSTLSECIDGMHLSIKKKSNLFSIINNWKGLVGEKLAENCLPIRLQNNILFIGAEHPQWRQALVYSRMKLISNLQASGYKIKDIKIQQYYQSKIQDSNENVISVWERHPSRIDVHGIAICPICECPAPSGEMGLWGQCGFCRRKSFPTINKNTN